MFDTSFFADPGTLALGAVTGFVFGFLLQKGGVTRFETIVGQFLLRDFTVLKVMGTAIVVGAIGVWGLAQMGALESWHIKTASLLGNAMGGVIFGAGMAVLGYCPGTMVGAAGDGARDAWFGILGGLAGAAVYAEAHPWISAHVLPVGDLGKATIPSETGVSSWWWIALLAIGASVGFGALERIGARRHRPAV